MGPCRKIGNEHCGDKAAAKLPGSGAVLDTPRLFYMHFWANDDAVKLAQGLKAALDSTNSRKP